jgi:hypothetical protein
MQPQEHVEQVFAKLKGLAPERVAEVEDFIDFLHSRDQDQAVTRGASRLSEPVLKRLWDNADDAAYDGL